jgi:hypothetical protein
MTVRAGRLEEGTRVSIGPVELLVIKFPGNQFKGEIAPALADLVESGTIRIIDLLFAITDEQGELSVLELNELDPDAYGQFDPVVDDLTGMLTEDDVRTLGARLGPNSSGAVMLFENTWATRFRDAVVNANGELILSERIPKAAIDELVAASAA